MHIRKVLFVFFIIYLLITLAYAGEASDKERIKTTENNLLQAQPLSSVQQMITEFSHLKTKPLSSPPYALIAGKLFTGDVLINNAALIIQGNVVTDILPVQRLPVSIKRLDFSKHTIVPGFIDLQLNGCGGVMFNDHAHVSTLEHMYHCSLKTGVTTFLPTLVSSPEKEVVNAISAIRDFKYYYPFASPGLHLEGPWLNPLKGGIHHKALIQPYDASASLSNTIIQASDAVTKVTLAPEKVPTNVIRRLSEAGVLVSVGHTVASANMAEQAFNAGAGFVTHLFNAMPGLVAREPGVIGATLKSPTVYAGIIADGMHVNWRNVSLSKRLLTNRLVLVTDGTAATNSPETTSFFIGGNQVTVNDGRCADAFGRLGGSSLTMAQAVNNVVMYAGIPPAEAWRMASLYPAEAIGADHMMGRLAPGYIAHAAILNEQGKVIATLAQEKVELHNTDLPHQEKNQYEQLQLKSPHIMVMPTKSTLGEYTAAYIAHKINTFTPSSKKPYFVLGLPTGSTPLPVYQHLVKLYREGKVSFKNVVTFNMDEYVGLPATHEQSYHYFMQHNLFQHIDILPGNSFILDGTAKNIANECHNFEASIKRMGGVDLFLGGIGGNGHVAFNEPGTPFNSTTHCVDLAQETIRDNARFFDGNIKMVPRKALTIGIATLMGAKEVIILATGEHKAQAVAEAVRGKYSAELPASALQAHTVASFFCDVDAAAKLPPLF